MRTVYRCMPGQIAGERTERRDWDKIFFWFHSDWGDSRGAPFDVIASMCGEALEIVLCSSPSIRYRCLKKIHFCWAQTTRDSCLSQLWACHAAADSNATMWTWFRKNTSICCVCILSFQDLWMNKLQSLPSPYSRRQDHVWNSAMKSIRCYAACLFVVLPKHFLYPLTYDSVADVLPLLQLP